MKKILLILLVLFLIAGGVLAFFVATFDPDKYKPILEEELTKAVGYPVTLGKISLEWKGGLSMGLSDLGIYESGGVTPDFEIVEANATLKILPLLNRNIEVGAVTIIRPDIRVLRKADGEIKISGINLEKLAAEQEPQKEALVLPFLINTIAVKGGSVRIQDEFIKPPIDLTLKKIDVTLKNVSLIRPTDIEAHVAVFSSEQNISFNGRLYPPRPGKSAALKNGEVSLDLRTIQISEIVRAIPAARDIGIKNRLGGTLQLNAEEIPLDPKMLETMKGSLDFRDGYLEHASVKEPIENMALKGTLKQNNLDFQELAIDWAGSQIRASGKIFQFATEPRSNLKGSIKNFNLAPLAATLPPNEPHLEGILQAQFDGQAAGLTWPTVSMSAVGEGQLGIQDAVLVNMNILNEALSKLSLVPGLMQRLEQRLPESYKEKMQARDTAFEPIDIPFKIRNGVLEVSNFRLASEMFEATGIANITVKGMIQAQCMLKINPDISDAFIRSVQELRYLTDGEGRLQLPLQIQGSTQKPIILPDLQYVASKLAVSKAQDLLSGLLGGDKQEEAPTQEQTEAATQEATQSDQAQNTNPIAEDPLGSLLGGLLQKALE